MSERFTGFKQGINAKGIDLARPVLDTMVIPSTLLMLSLAAWKPRPKRDPHRYQSKRAARTWGYNEGRAVKGAVERMDKGKKKGSKGK